MAAEATSVRFSDEALDQLVDRLDSLDNETVIWTIILGLDMIHGRADEYDDDGMHNIVTCAKSALTSLAVRDDLTSDDFVKAYLRALNPPEGADDA